MARERRSRFANAILVISDDDAAARYGEWLESLLVGMVDEGMNPVLIAPRNLRVASSIPERAIARFPMPQTRWNFLRRWSSRPMLDNLAGEPVRMVFSTAGRLTPYAAWLAEQLNVPLATLVTGIDEIRPALSVEARLATLFAASGALAELARDRLAGRQPDRVIQVSLGVHLGPRTAAFADDHIPGIVTYGQLERGRGFEEFIGAAAQLAERGYEAAFFIVGAGEAEQHLRRLARARNLNNRLTFVPEPRRMDDIFDGIDVFIQPYVCQRLDLMLLHAMASGVVVLARNGQAVDFVRDGVNGIELTTVDEPTLVMLLSRLLDEPAIGRRLGDAARQFVQASHLAGVTVQQIVDRIRQFAVKQQTLRVPGG